MCKNDHTIIVKGSSSFIPFFQRFVQKKTSLLPLVWSLIVPLFTSATIIWMVDEFDSIDTSSNIFTLLLLISIPAMALAITPTTFIAFLSGFLFGFEVLPFVIMAYLASSLTGYYAAGFFDRGWVGSELSRYPRAGKMVSYFRKKPFALVFFGRLSPFLPFAFMNIVLRYLGINLKTFFLAGAIGMLPRTAFFVWVGEGARSFKDYFSNPNGFTKPNFFTLMLVLLSLIGLFLYFRRALSKSE